MRSTQYSQQPVLATQPVYQKTLNVGSGFMSPSGREAGSLRGSPRNETVSNASFLQGMKASLNQRKQSHDLRGRNNLNLTATMGAGLRGMGGTGGSSYRHGLASPRNVISGARDQVAMMNNTINGDVSSRMGSLQVNGGRKQGWDNPDSTARNGMHMRDNKLSIQDIVDNVLKKPAFGFEGYYPKAVVKDLLPVNTHVRAKAKRRMFCEEASRAKDKVPAADKYQTAIDWNKDPETRTIKFYSDKRRMVADEIIAKSKHPEKTSPGPTGYSHYDGWKKTLKSVPGNYKQKEDRITFVSETGWKANQSPGFKYPTIDLRKFKETSPPRTHIQKGEGRFGVEKKLPEKYESPGPTSYDIEGSHKFANGYRGRNAFDKTKRVSFCETQSKLNISPGPAKHTHSIKVLDKLSLSPLASSRKRL